MEYSRSQRWLRPNAGIGKAENSDSILRTWMNTKAKWTHRPVVRVKSTNRQYRHCPNSNSILKAQFMYRSKGILKFQAFIRVNFCMQSKLKRDFSKRKKKKKKLKRDWSWIIMKLTGISRTPANDITQSLHHTKLRTYISQADSLFESPTNFQIVHKP